MRAVFLPRSAQGAETSSRGRLEPRQRLADQAVVDTGGAVLAAGEDPVAGRAEAAAVERRRIAAEIEEKLTGAGVPEPGAELAGGDDPVAVRAVAARVDGEEVTDQVVDRPAATDVPDHAGVVDAHGEEVETVGSELRVGDGRTVTRERVQKAARG